MQVPLVFSLRMCLVHRMYFGSMHRLVKKATRLMPSCIVFIGIACLLLLTGVQLVTYQNDFVHYPALSEPSELIRNLTKQSNQTNANILNTNYIHMHNRTRSSAFIKSSLFDIQNSISNFIPNSLSATLSSSSSNSLNSLTSTTTTSLIASSSTFHLPPPKSRSAANLSNLINVTHHHDFLNRPALSRMIISSNKTSLLKAKKSDPFKIEALLSQSPSAFQTNNREMNELTNKGRIKQIIKNFLSEQRLESNLTRSSSKDTLLNQQQQQQQQQQKSSNQTSFEHCPLSPPNLVGRMRVDLNLDNLSPDFLNETVSENNYVEENGSFRPAFCIPQHKVAIIIPYRDREQHLHILLKHLHGVLQRQLLRYKIFVIEQFGNDTFNKGVLMNAGAREATSEQHFHCFVFHDVDLIPEDDRTLYSCPKSPRHLSVAVDKFNYSLPYSLLIGGVFAISQTHFNMVNGYSNLYWGWGAEDDDMSHRLKFHNLHIIRPPESIGRYTMIKHEHRKESPSNVRYALLRLSTKRSSRDGLSSVHYRVVGRNFDSKWGFEHITITIGSIHKWHFQSKNKLILHF